MVFLQAPVLPPLGILKSIMEHFLVQGSGCFLQGSFHEAMANIDEHKATICYQNLAHSDFESCYSYAQLFHEPSFAVPR